MVSLQFLITSLIVVVSPGPGTLLTVAAGLSGGARAAAVTALGLRGWLRLAVRAPADQQALRECWLAWQSRTA